MATWQYDIHLVPRGAVKAADPGSSNLYDEDLAAEEWQRYGDTKELLARLAGLLPPLKSWHESISMWGAEDGNRIDVSFEGSNIDGIMVRIDVRRISLPFIESLIEIALEGELMLVLDGGAVVAPEASILLCAVRRSNAFRFVQDPVMFLEALAKKLKMN